MLLGLVNSAFANASVKILKIFSNKREFVVQKTPDLEDGTELVIVNAGSSRSGTGKIKVCKARSCLAELDVGIFELDPKLLKSYRGSVRENQFGNSVYLGYGSPLGGALKLGLRKLNNQDFSYGIYLTRIDSSSGSTKVKANAVSVQGIYELYQNGDWTANLNGELGIAFSVLEFKNDVDQRNVKENVYMGGLSLEGLYRLDRFQAGVNVGVSRNGFKSKYAGQNGEFSNPFGTTLLYSEIGFHYEF